MRGVFLDKESVDRDDLDFTQLREVLDEYRDYPNTSDDQLATRVVNAEVIVSNKVMLDAEAIAAARELQLICIAATGTNNVDLEFATSKGIAVCNVRAYATASVVEHVFSMLLTLVRRLPEYTHAVRQGRWQQSDHFCLLDYPIAELNGMTLGIVGYGELGRAVSHAAEAFGMRVLIAQRPGGEPQTDRIALTELLPQVDVLSLHCPLTEQTRNLIDSEALASMKSGSILINTARGGIVDELALAEALRSGHLFAAGIDVFATEPVSMDNPLLALSNVVVAPHIGSASVATRSKMAALSVDNLLAGLRGEPIPHCVKAI